MGTMSSATLRLVLLVSCCHALVHVYEHSLASVEQLVVADEAFDVPAERQEKVSGVLGNWLRLPFGLCALLAGWLADRFGAKRLLLVTSENDDDVDRDVVPKVKAAVGQ